MKVVVLGCGPAGLFAAHAAVQSGQEVSILSKPRKSYMKGAQYLHRPIPGLSGDSFTIDYRLEGTVEGYKKKVYGDLSDILVSPETLTGLAEAWDIREAYDKAWDLYGHLVKEYDAELDGLWTPELRGADLILSTIPAKLICDNKEHAFESQLIWSTDFIKYVGGFTLEDGSLADNLVRCSGDPDDWWYRQSRIHGWENTEYPISHRPNTDRVWEVEKPIRTNCTCNKDIVRLGRYGKWTKGVLSDSAYYETETLIGSMNV